MTRKSEIPAPEVPGIDLTFRPASYFWPLGLETHLLARIKGAERKAAARRLIDAGDLDRVPDFLLQSALSDDVRQTLGRIHPAMMGGEYLPDLTTNEVQIARITIASTTQDVTSVYARRRKDRIHYRVVDEYAGDTLSAKSTRTSIRPLTLAQLERFFTGAWPLFHVLDVNFGENGYDLQEILDFVIGVDSEFYPQIDALFRRRIEVWTTARRAELAVDELHGDGAFALTGPGSRRE